MHSLARRECRPGVDEYGLHAYLCSIFVTVRPFPPQPHLHVPRRYGSLAPYGKGCQPDALFWIRNCTCFPRFSTASNGILRRDQRLSEVGVVKILERAANVSAILGVTVFLVLVFRGELAKRHPAGASAEGLIGRTVSLPGVIFPQQRNSLVLALSTSCHFCKESLPFYKDLTERSAGRLNVVAVLPQPAHEAQTYIQAATIKATQVVSADLDSIGVSATPTVLLLDSSGKVRGAWVGLLDDKAQKKLLAVVLPR
jgi:hypothetical protein